jgi:ribosomal protein S13
MSKNDPPLKRPSFSELKALSEQPTKPVRAATQLVWPATNPLKPPREFPQDVGTQATQVGTQMGTLSTQGPGSMGTQTTQTSQGTHDDPQPEPRRKRKDDRAQLNLKISWEKLERFKAWCYDKGIGQKEAVEMALEQLMGGVGTQSTRATLSTQAFDFHRPGSSLDDVDLETINIIIPALFEQVVGREMNPDDWQAFAEWRHYGGNAIACAILAGAVRKLKQSQGQGRIGSFRYFKDIIPEFADAQKTGSNLRTYKNKLWSEWEKVRKRATR